MYKLRRAVVPPAPPRRFCYGDVYTYVCMYIYIYIYINTYRPQWVSVRKATNEYVHFDYYVCICILHISSIHSRDN